MLKNVYLVVKIGVYSAENGPSKIHGDSQCDSWKSEHRAVLEDGVGGRDAGEAAAHHDRLRGGKHSRHLRGARAGCFLRRRGDAEARIFLALDIALYL